MNQMALARVNDCGSSMLAETVSMSISIGLGGVIFICLTYYLFLSKRGKSLKSNARSIFRRILRQSTMILISSAIHLIYGYGSPLFFFALFVTVCFIGVSLNAVLSTLYHVIYSSSLQSYPKIYINTLLVINLILVAGPFLAIFVLSLVFANEPERFNDALIICFATGPLHLVITMPLFFSSIKQLSDKTNEVLQENFLREGRRSLNPKRRTSSMTTNNPFVLTGLVYYVCDCLRCCYASQPRPSEEPNPESPKLGGFVSPNASASTRGGDSPTNRIVAHKQSSQMLSSPAVTAQREKMELLAQRLRTYKWFTILFWIPLEIALYVTLAVGVYTPGMNVDYVFFVGINVMQLSSLLFTTIVISSPKWFASLLKLRRTSNSSKQDSKFKAGNNALAPGHLVAIAETGRDASTGGNLLFQHELEGSKEVNNIEIINNVDI